MSSFHDKIDEAINMLYAIKEQLDNADGQKEPANVPVDIQKTIRQLSYRSGIDMDRLTGMERSREIADVRKMIAHVLKSKGYRLCDIARGLQRDHSTIKSMLDQHAVLIQTDKTYTQTYQAITYEK